MTVNTVAATARQTCVTVLGRRRSCVTRSGPVPESCSTAQLSRDRILKDMRRSGGAGGGRSRGGRSGRRATATPPAAGERIAAGGLGAQYKIAATIVLSLLRDLESVRVADPDAGAVDDFAVITEREVHGVQVKWPVYPGQFTLGSICSVNRHGRGLVRDLAEGWCRLREREAWSGRGRRVVVHLATRDWPSRSRETARLDDCPQKHVAAFFRLGLRPVQDALRRGEPPPVDAHTAWAAAFTAMMEASGLPDVDSFHAFLTDLYIDVGVTDSPAVLAGLPGQTAWLQRDVQRLAEYFFAVVAGLADDGDTVEITVERLLDALGWQHRSGFRNPHRFPVPVAYSPNAEVAEALTGVVRQHTQGYVLLEGAPGSGKSTLLTATALPVDRVVRYYAYVPDSPDRASSRGEAESFLAHVCEELGQTGLPVVAMGGSLSAVRERLADALDAAGEDWASRGVRTTIVVDGLDHNRARGVRLDDLDETAPFLAEGHRKRRAMVQYSLDIAQHAVDRPNVAVQLTPVIKRNTEHVGVRVDLHDRIVRMVDYDNDRPVGAVLGQSQREFVPAFLRVKQSAHRDDPQRLPLPCSCAIVRLVPRPCRTAASRNLPTARAAFSDESLRPVSWSRAFT